MCLAWILREKQPKLSIYEDEKVNEFHTKKKKMSNKKCVLPESHPEYQILGGSVMELWPLIHTNVQLNMVRVTDQY